MHAVRLYIVFISILFIFVFLSVQLVGEALFWTLGQGLGAAYTREVQDAWNFFYRFVSDCLKEGMNEARWHKTEASK